MALWTDLQAYARAIDSIRRVHGADSIAIFVNRNPDEDGIYRMKVFTFRGTSGTNPAPLLSRIEQFITGDYDAVYLSQEGKGLRIALVKWKKRKSKRVNLRQGEKDLFIALNEYRQYSGLKPINWSQRLYSLALQHSRDMVRRKQLDHRGFGERFEKSGFNRCVENVALTPLEQMDIAIELWKKSKNHRKNMLEKTITHGAIAVDTTGEMAYITFFACGKGIRP